MRRWVEYAGYRFLAFFVPLLPRSWMVRVGRFLGGVFARFSKRARDVGRENLRRTLPDHPNPDGLLLEAARLQGVALLDAIWSKRLTPESASQYLQYDEKSLVNILGALDTARGLVVATAHFGSWEMFNLGAGARGLPRATFIAREIPNPRIDRHLKAARERTGNKLVYRREAMPMCLKALRRGEIACSVIDIAVRPSEGGVFAPFFSIPAMTSSALPFLAVKRNAPLYFVLCRPIDGGHRYVLEAEHIPIDREADPDTEIKRVTAELNRALEAAVRKHPECWLWSYKRWKWRPSELGSELFPDYSLWIWPLW